mgnify:FL=1
MQNFREICSEFEKLGALERSVILAEKSVKILARLKALDIDGVDPVYTLAGFVIGAIAADGAVDEKEYLLIYPALVKVFGANFNYASVKQAVKENRKSGRELNKSTKEMLRLLEQVDEGFKRDVIILCLCIVSVDGKVSLKEKRYIKNLWF